MRLIDADALIGSIATIAKKLARSDAQKALMGRVMYIFEHRAEDVVRCKDCVLRKTEDCMMYYECDCGEQHTWESDNDFCSHGERREET